MKAFFDAHPNFAQRFPGGIVQFAQMAGELPEDALDDIMIAANLGNEGGQNREMPGAMPDFQEVRFVDDEEEDGNGGRPPAVVAQNAPADNRNHDDDGEGSNGEDEGDEDSDEEEVAVSLISHHGVNTITDYQRSPFECY